MFPLAGGLAGGLGAALFLTLHAILLVPIWFALAPALVAGAIAGAGTGYAFSVLVPPDRTRPSLAHGVAFGVALWLALLPPSAHQLTVKTVWPDLADPLDVPLVLASLVLPAAAAAWRYRRSRRTVTITVAAVIGVFIITGGPIGPPQFRRGAPLLVGLLPIFTVAGACLAVVLRGLAGWLRHLSVRAV
jgi:hypothetical protein